jgi:aminoglycoside phosphotransferase (APT) family kinase protein
MGPVSKSLVGYSGARLVLTAGGVAPTVRKISAGPSHNARLQLQMNRQSEFHALPSRPFLVPAVLEQGMIGELFYFDMEYVSAVGAPYFLASAPVAEIERFGANLLRTLEFLKSSPSASSPLEASIDQLSEKIFSVARVESRLNPSLLFRLLQALHAFRHDRTYTLRPTLYHGDFTLENLLVADDQQLVLIDYLDSPLDHYWQDIAKIYADIGAHWYARRHPRISEWVARSVEDVLTRFVQERDPAYWQMHDLLVALNFVRILPYAKQEEDRNFLLRNIEFHINRIPRPA